MGRATKATKKFAASGQLKKTIQARHKSQAIRKKIQGRKGSKGGKPQRKSDRAEDEDDDEEPTVKPQASMNKKGIKSVDDFLSGGFMEGSDDDLEEGAEDVRNPHEDMSEDGEDFDDNTSFASVDGLEDEGQAHLLELSKLAEKDPEFFKYLQENDRELLEFNPGAAAEDEVVEDEDMEAEEEKTPNLTKEHLRQWQKALLEHRSLKALRKLLIAFRAAAHMNEDDEVVAWSIASSSVYNKLVTTTLRYTPIVLEHHVPYKTLANGKFKPPTQTHKFKTLQKMILAYFHNMIHLLSQLTNTELLRLAVTESAKIIPYVVSSRKSVKLYLKTCLELWSSAEDDIRIGAFLSIRRLALSSDDSILDTILKNTYLTLIRSSKSTNVHTLPSINLMKNSASEVFCIDHAVAYQHAFGYIRQLAIHLRNSMKIKTKESYKQVYNWQFVHSIDFWCINLAKACSKEAEVQTGKESEMKALIYPLVQVALGAIKLIPNSRSYPFHLQIIRSILSLTKHTETYVPVSPYLVPILTSIISPSSKPKSSTLKPLDFETQIRVPQQYVKTRVYYEGVAEETTYLLAEWLSSPAVHGSAGFPEIIVPIVVLLRRSLKAAKSNSAASGTSKEQGMVKTLLERVEESAKWVENQRANVAFGPGKTAAVADWEEGLRKQLKDAPLSKYLKVQLKAREKRRKLLEKARAGEDEILEEE
ncbi:Noc2-domain-containing protein [Macrolepiota fuliginosa MF-IS2]|uniref:Noc2-domain-containing protein n=1 Tax=Macrolepiota fuliginosa MF-IS2 TaxID=1400762 RepID=A0A9P5X7F2_9AGAR|nr:Noc2-domain-containing protein [Macrolepiota fuliginosa MF-IS2]